LPVWGREFERNNKRTDELILSIFRINIATAVVVVMTEVSREHFKAAVAVGVSSAVVGGGGGSVGARDVALVGEGVFVCGRGGRRCGRWVCGPVDAWL
jgi:hypothetical protein